jgi:hypothetical protein
MPDTEFHINIYAMARRLVNAMEMIGLVLSPVMFDTQSIPDIVKHRSFRLLPEEINPKSAIGGYIEFSIGWALYIAYQPPPMEEAQFFIDVVCKDLENIVRALVEVPEFEAPITASSARDEDGRYLVLNVNVRTAFASPRT